MSFFGFDTNLPRDKNSNGGGRGIFEHADPFTEMARGQKLQVFRGEEHEELDFEDTYDGLGDQLEETGDDLNADTFGGDLGQTGAPVGTDFDFFGNTAQVTDAIGQEQMRYHMHGQPSQPISTARAQKPKKTGYEKYQDPGYIPDIQAKSGAWSSKSRPGVVSTGEEKISTAKPPSESKKMLSLEEVEAQIRDSGRQSHFAPPQPAVYSIPAGKVLPQLSQSQRPSAEQGEQYVPYPTLPSQQQSRVPQVLQQRTPQQPLQILQNPNRPRHSPQPSTDRTPAAPTQPSVSLPVITSPEQLMELSEEQRRVYLDEDAKRAKRNHKIFMLSKGNGLMTPQDKNFITRIQLQQLVATTGNSADPNPEAALAEDFYFQVYTQIRGAPRQHPSQPLGHFALTYLFQTGTRTNGPRRHPISGDNHMQRMQQQVQRAVEAAKLKPKNKQLIIEGSLGKISFSNAKTPKPLLNIKRQESGDSRPASSRRGLNTSTPSDRKTTLRNIESVYTTLMELEDHTRQMPPPPQEGNADAVEAHIQWRQKLTKLNTSLWQQLKVLDPIVPGSLDTHPFIAFLTFAKGKKALSRVFRLIDQEQKVTILTMIVVHLDQLDVVRNGKVPSGESQPPASSREDIDLFSQAVMPSLLSYVSEAPINIMSGLLGLLVEHTNIGNVVQTRIGLCMLTMFLSRAELVKETGSVTNEDRQQWSAQYNRFFDSLEPYFGVLFPGNVNTADDIYVWQFLAAVGIGASPEQQQRLVLGVKDRVMETVMQSKSLPPEMSSTRLGNVNLFMRAIGLDVEMLG